MSKVTLVVRGEEGVKLLYRAGILAVFSAFLLSSCYGTDTQGASPNVPPTKAAPTTVNEQSTTVVETPKTDVETTKTSTNESPPDASSFEVSAYYPFWSSDNAVSDQSLQKVTTANFPFVLIEDGRCAVPVEEAKQFQSSVPDTATKVMSIGGANEKGFPQVAAGDVQRFANDCVEKMLAFDFDGIDIDWEHPVDDKQKNDFTTLIQAFDQALKNAEADSGVDYQLDIALPTGRNMRFYDMATVNQYVDHINLMAYDFVGFDWSQKTGHQASLFKSPNSTESYGSDEAIQELVDLGVPKNKILLGVPFYGRAWGCIDSSGPPNLPGLFETGCKVSSAPFNAAGDIAYKDIRKSLNEDTGYKEYYDEESKASYLHNAEQGIFVTFDSPKVIKDKLDYINAQGLGGVMIWSLDQDNGELMEVLS